MAYLSRAVLLLALAWKGQAIEASLNPIRKVVTMLQTMQKRVEAEGAKEADLYEKFMCFCKTNGKDISGSIAAAQEKIPAVSSEIKADEAKLAGAKSDLKSAQVDRITAGETMDQATALRKKEAAAFASLKADYEANIAAIAKAVAALSKGMVGGFLQTPTAQHLRNAISKMDIPSSDQEVLTAFLSQDSKYAPQSGEITGMLKQMGDTMAANLAEATATEEAAIATYTALMASKKKEVGALTATVEAKTGQVGKLSISLASMKHDLGDTEAALAADQTFLAGLQKGCSTKTAEWEERTKTRAAELVALADTIKVLNDDDALELFKKTLPSGEASLLQVQEARSAMRARALSKIRAAQQLKVTQDKAGLALLALALTGKSTGAGFGKVIKMIDDLVADLATEQKDDDTKLEYCKLQHDLTDDKIKGLNRVIAGKKADISAGQEGIAALAEEIASLTASIKALDKAVAEATEDRKQENAEYKDLIASNTAAKELLNFAKNRLNKFYNGKLHKAAAPQELSEEDTIYSKFGGEVPTEAPSGIAGTGVTVFAQVSAHKVSVAPPPETWSAYTKKSEENGGVVAMLNLLIQDLDKEISEAEAGEKDAQADYQEMMKASAEKRMTDSESLTEKSSAKADMEAEMQADTDAKEAGEKELMATKKYEAALHAECDWLMEYHGVRKEARASEVDSLKSGKAVLSGAEYSFLQMKSVGFLRRLK